MAWNEPGGGPKNPWGKRPSRDGRSDDALKNFQRRIESILKGAGVSGGGDDPTDPPAETRSQLLGVLGIIGALWAYQCFFTIDQAERGVIQRFGKFVSVRDPGLGFHLWPVERLTKVNTQKVNSVNYTAKVLTQDINLVDMSLAVQYQLRDPVKYLFQVKDPEQTLRDVGEMAIREVVGRSSLETIFVSNREQVTARTKELIQRTLDQYGTGILITSVNLTDIQVPTDVQESQRDANKALADKERLMKEAEAYSSGILPVAEGAASRQLQEAEGYRAQVIAVAEGEAARFGALLSAYQASPKVTRDRLYIEGVETVLARSKKVFVDAKGNGNMIYLPLDKLVERPQAAGGEAVVSAPRGSAGGGGASAESDATGDARARVER